MTKKISIANIISEELTPDQKERVNKWIPKTKTTPAERISSHVFPGDRIKIPIESQERRATAPAEIEHHLSSHGYSISDYHNGTVVDKHGRTMKLGKALSSTKAPQHMINGFANDPARANKEQSNHEIIISRHPHDVAGMSTDRGWTSCMHMEHGSNSSALKDDIKQGTHVAYLVKKGDDEIKNPIARIALKPVQSTTSTHKILRPEGAAYGEATDSFTNSVVNWAHSKFPMKDLHYKTHDSLYNDGMEEHHVNHEAIENDISKFHNLPHEDKWNIIYHLYTTPAQRATRSKLIDAQVEKHGYGDTGSRYFIAANGDDHHRDKLIHDDNPNIRMAVFNSGNEHHQNHLAHNETDGNNILQMTYNHLHNNSVSSPLRTITKRIVSDPESTKDSYIDTTVRHIAASKHTELHDMLETAKDPKVRAHLADATDSPERLSRMIHDPVKDVAYRAISNPEASKNDLIQVMNHHPDLDARKLAVGELHGHDLSDHVSKLHPEVAHFAASTTTNSKTFNALKTLNDPEVHRRLQNNSLSKFYS